MAVEISSKDNPLIKEYIKLKGNKNYRKKRLRIAVEGPNLVFAALNASYKPEVFYFTRDFLHSAWSQHKMVYPRGIKELILDEKLFKYMADTETPQAVAAIFNFSYPHFKIPASPLKGPVLILDRVSDPGNMGAIIRTAVAAGAGKIYYTAGSTDPFSPKALRATAGTIFQLPPEHSDNTLELFSYLKEKGFTIFVSSANGGRDFQTVNYPEKTALVIGNEAEGASEEICLSADMEVTIALQGKVESLNAAVAAGILLFEINRQTQ